MTKMETAKQQTTSPSLVSWIVLAVIGLGGILLAWGLQLSQGMGITGLGEQVVWGIYIAGFFTAMGAGAALVALTALSEFMPLLPIALRRHALLLAIAGFVVGALLIAMDVGYPMNLLRILAAGRFTSLMTWDFLILVGTGILTVIYLAVSWKQEATTGGTRIWGALALVSAALLIVVEGWMLATLSARPLWLGGLTVANFLVLALVAGLSLAIMAWAQAAPQLARWLKIALWVTLVLLFIELATILSNDTVRPYPEVSLSLSGQLTASLWLYLIVGLLVPLAILYWRKDLIWLRIAAGLAVLGVLTEKVWLLTAGQALPWLPLPQATYVPSWVELVGILGAIALSVLIYRVLIKVLKVDAKKV